MGLMGLEGARAGVAPMAPGSGGEAAVGVTTAGPEGFGLEWTKE
jgi:hypothetical protein